MSIVFGFLDIKCWISAKPNVIIILTDDQGYGDIAAHGNEVIKTPSMDKMYNEGVHFTNYHSGTTCAPSRSGLMTGADGNRAGVWHTIGGASLLREKFVLMPQIFEKYFISLPLIEFIFDIGNLFASSRPFPQYINSHTGLVHGYSIP